MNTKERGHPNVRSAGTGCIWPKGMLLRYGISAPTLWRWERIGKLPPRDVYIGGKPVGWKPATIEAAERGETAAS
jgi:predicted DNA-binding transcriptional regulator AlpA